MTTYLAKKPKIPYMSMLLSLKPDHMIRITGMIAKGRKKFGINLQNNNQAIAEPNDDVPLHIDIRPLKHKCIVRNSFTAGQWNTEENEGGCPIGVNEFFELVILITSDCYKIAINEDHFCDFEHRLSLTQAKYLHIYQDAEVAAINLEDANASLIKYPFVRPTYENEPYILSLGTNGLKIGEKIHILGKTTHNAETITINLVQQVDEAACPELKVESSIIFHIGIRIADGIIVRNTFENDWYNRAVVTNNYEGEWQEEEREGRCPIGRSENYSITIYAKDDYFDVRINGLHFCNFKYRMSVRECRYIFIKGDTSLDLVKCDQ